MHTDTDPLRNKNKCSLVRLSSIRWMKEKKKREGMQYIVDVRTIKDCISVTEDYT